MQYLLMCCFEERRWDALPAGQRDDVMRRYGVLVDEWIGEGRYVVGGKLQSSATATTVRHAGGKPVVIDGPFAETKEQLGGYHVLDCANLDEALEQAARIPTLAAGGTVEVRPLQHLLGSPTAV